MCRRFLIHPDNVPEERVPACLNESTDVWQALAALDLSVLDLVLPPDAEDPPLASHMKGLHMGHVRFC